jgi:AcrR family transcriptional regulator
MEVERQHPRAQGGRGGGCTHLGECRRLEGALGTAARTARERILETAEDLFYREGIRAVGIDTIIEKSGVAKMSVYRSFPSKDDLVAAYLEMRSARYWKWWDDVMARHPDQPRRQLHDLFEGLVHRVRRPEFRGCAFVNAATEFPDKTSRARAVALAHKDELRRRLLKLAAGVGAAHPKALANQLLMLIDGIYSTVGVLERHDAIKAVAQAADVLIDAAIEAA